MLPMLQFLSDEKTYSFKKINNHLVTFFKLANEEIEFLTPNGKKRLFANRCDWARFYLKKAKLIESPKTGFIKISNEGVSFLKSHQTEIHRNTLLEIPSFSKFIKEINEKYYNKKKKNTSD